MATATIQQINKINDQTIQASVIFSDGATKTYTFDISIDKEDIIQAIKVDVDNLKALEDKVTQLQADLINTIIS